MRSLAGDLHTILTRAESDRIRPRNEARSVWELDGIGNEVEAVRDRIIELVLGCDLPVIVAYDEPPEDPGLIERVESLGDQRYRCRGPISVASVRHWLSPGNWQMMSPSMPEVWVDLVRAKSADVERFVAEHRLEFVIDSFHDDVYWVVAWKSAAAGSGGRTSFPGAP